MGKFDGTVEAYDEGIIVNGKKIKFFAEKILHNFLGKTWVLKLL